MAVTSVKVSHEGWNGSADVIEGYTFNVTYLAEVDDPQDGVYEVLSSPKMPTIGSAYEVGNDRYYLTGLKNLSATPVAGTRNLWEIVGTYGRIKPDGADEEQITTTTEENTPTAKEDDPTEWPAIVTLNTTRVSRAAQFGVYMGQKRYIKGRNQNQDVALAVGNAGAFNLRWRQPQPQAEVLEDFKNNITNDIAITNSNFKPFDPAPEIDYTRYNVNIAFRTVNYPSVLIDSINSINSNAFLLNHLLETEDDNGNPRILHTKLAVAKNTMKLQGVDITPMHANGVGYFSVSVDLEIDPLYGWRLDILDRGYSELDETLEPDGSYATPGKTKLITDEAGNALKEPSLLDGHGKRLNLNQLDAVYLTYAVYPEIDFTLLKIHQPQLMKNLK